MRTSGIRRVALLGNFLPRQCGIATFTSDVANHVSQTGDGILVDVVAMNDREGYEYPSQVCHSILASDRKAYVAAAEVLNQRKYDVLNVQHEFGIFGGPAGDYLLDLLRAVKMPIVTTLHTILLNPSDDQRRVIMELAQLSEKLISMTLKGSEILKDTYGIEPSKIEFIHHGIPDGDYEGGLKLRDERGIGNRVLLLTFGLLSKDKGIHYAIQALPEIVKEVPNVLYGIVGATHPHIKSREGEAYRESLLQMAQDLGVSDNVMFIDEFVSNEELASWLAATDIYLTPYLKAEQITSGTLAYALGNGNVVVSTPFWHAEELLDEDRGILVPFHDSEAIAKAIVSVAGNPFYASSIRSKARAFGAEMRWPVVAKKTVECFDNALISAADRLRSIVVQPRRDASVWPPLQLPTMQLQHLVNLTDDTGLLQHATYRIPNRAEGYCVDDNARGLLLTASETDVQSQKLTRTYLSFLAHAWNDETQSFRNFMSFDRRWLDEAGGDDSNARAVHALTVTARRCQDQSARLLARRLLEPAWAMIEKTISPRAWAFGVLACSEMGTEAPENLIAEFATRLQRLLKNDFGPNWYWFEDRLAYDNARLSQALIVAGHPEGLDTLRWLMNLQTGANGEFAPIGSNGFWIQGNDRAWFDQQPLEAWATASACVSAHRITGESIWLREAERAFAWFLGRNMTNTVIADVQEGACADGLHETRLNLNCGAESTLSYLLALQELRNLKPLMAERGNRVYPA